MHRVEHTDTRHCRAVKRLNNVQGRHTRGARLRPKKPYQPHRQSLRRRLEAGEICEFCRPELTGIDGEGLEAEACHHRRSEHDARAEDGPIHRSQDVSRSRMRLRGTP